MEIQRRPEGLRSSRRATARSLYARVLGASPVRERRKQKQDRWVGGPRRGSGRGRGRSGHGVAGCSAHSGLGDVQRPDRARGQALGRVAVGHGGEPEEEGSVAQKVDALDVLCLLRLAVTGVRDAAIARGVRTADALAQRGLERVELGIGDPQAQRAVERM
ncbi:hypothetical protein GSI_01664 [Ganoderma sinense ZZ0214-1]|uniref:Uncharacterized protein n=1 Tax=Ganoderma sinense ZZ0214-1 TaxID=1077348 RepID=A0A2G8SQG1_9APHY|nr:hypothetical protein GSI_01664 [Ganoderma sinense ZZ0214-1]